MQVNADILPGLFGAPAVTEILANLANPMGMRELVTRLSSDTDLGDALWRQDATCASMLSFQQAVVAQMAEWIEKSKTEEGYAQVLGAIDELVAEYMARGVTPIKRQIRLRFLGYEVPMVVIDMSWEAQLRLHAAIKSQCLGQSQGVQMLLHETWLGTPQPGSCAWPSKVTDGMNQARKLASSMLENDKLQTLDHVRDALIGGQESMIAADPYFVLEIEFAKTALTDGVARVVRESILSFMPSAKGHPTSLEICVAKLESFKASRLGELCSNASKGEIESTLGVVQKMMRGLAPPDGLRKSTPFYQDFYHSLQYFLRAEVDENGSKKTLFGSDVVKERLASLRLTLAKDKSPAQAKEMLVQLERFHAFRYLMTEEQCKDHSELTKELVARGAKASKKERAKTEVISKKKAAKPKAEAEQPGQSDSVMSFF